MLLSMLFSWAGISLGVVGFIAAAIALRYFRFPQWSVYVCVALAAAYLYSGWIGRLALAECQAKWDAAVEIEQARVAAANTRADGLELTLSIIRNQRDREADERQAENEVEIVREDAESPNPGACTDTERDLERLRDAYRGQ